MTNHDLVDDAGHPLVHRKPVTHIISHYSPASDDCGRHDGTAWSWADEFGQLWEFEPEYMAGLTGDIRMHGIRHPLLLSRDGAVQDGHHRLAVAVALLMDEVPVRVRAQRKSNHSADEGT